MQLIGPLKAQDFVHHKKGKILCNYQWFHGKEIWKKIIENQIFES